MHFDTTGCETKEFKAAGGVADSGEKADLTGIDCASYSIEAADGTRWIRPTKSAKRQTSSTTRLEDA